MIFIVRLKSDNFYKFCIKRNITIRDVSKKIGVSEQYINLWLTHRRTPNGKNRKKIMNLFRKSKWDDLFVLDKRDE